MTKTEFYSSLATNARMQGYTATKTENGLKLNSVVVSINNNVVTIVDNNNNVIDITNWNRAFIDNMVSITLDTIIKKLSQNA